MIDNNFTTTLKYFTEACDTESSVEAITNLLKSYVSMGFVNPISLSLKGGMTGDINISLTYTNDSATITVLSANGETDYTTTLPLMKIDYD